MPATGPVSHDPSPEPVRAQPPARTDGDLADRVAALEQEVASLRAELAELRGD